MLPVPGAEVFIELLFLAVAVLPLGAVLLRLGERILRCPTLLPAPERLLLAFFASGALLFVLASLPVAFYGFATVVTLLLAGAVSYVVICYRDGAIGFRVAFSFVTSVPGALLGILAIGVVAVGAAGVASLTLGNMLDGSVHSLFVNLLLRDHTLPWTLAPYAGVGVAYPQGAPVWMSVPVLLFDWPIVSAPLDVPPLFFGLATVAAFCLGQRWASAQHSLSPKWAGLLFAAFFGLVVLWTPLSIGGSPDFVFALPLFVLLLGWLVPLVRSAKGDWRVVAAFGVVAGVEISLSLMLGIATLLLLAGYILVFRTSQGPRLHEWAIRWLAIVGVAAIFLVRSVTAVTLWFGYPGHILTPVGLPPTAPAQLTLPLSPAYLNDELNPFVLFKPKLSPIPVLSFELEVLLVAGVILAGLVLARPRGLLRSYLPRDLVLPILVGGLVAFMETAGILLLEWATPNSSGVASITNIEEASAVLFLFYQLTAILPLFAAASFLTSNWQRIQPVTAEGGWRHRRARRAFLRACQRPMVILLAVVLLVPLSLGLGATADQIPSYITGHIHGLANVSEADISALKWAGSHLPTCSRVLVAPGSVGQYLPEFATVSIVFPAFPAPANLSYYIAVQDLDAGIYNNDTHERLLELGVTEVFISGRNSVSYPPFQLGPLASSPDFASLVVLGDVTILEFLSGAVASGCIPATT